MEIKPIRNARDHNQALREIERLWGSAKGTRRGDRLDVLIALVDAYERTRVYEVMRGDRGLSLAMIRRLHKRLGIPAEVLIRPIAKRRRAA
jgi:HTH-type transcriptional regulator/antitoxin HigA